MTTEQANAAGDLLAAEARFLQAYGWEPWTPTEPGGDVRWKDPTDGCFYGQGLAVTSQRKRIVLVAPLDKLSST